MILLSKLADYAVVLSVQLACAQRDASPHPPSSQLTTQTLANATRLSLATVAKVLKILVHASLVASVRGPAGGYRLARPASLITISDILVAFDGPFGMTECSQGDDHCARRHYCSARPHWAKLNEAISAALKSVTIADMVPAPSLAFRGAQTLYTGEEARI